MTTLLTITLLVVGFLGALVAFYWNDFFTGLFAGMLFGTGLRRAWMTEV